MIVVLDASALSAFLLEESGSEKIREMLAKEVRATELVMTETCNAILTALRRKRISEEDARNAVDVLLSFRGSNLKINVQDPKLLLDAYENAREHHLAIYDSIYLALAKRLGAALASRDPAQIEAARKSGVKVINT